MTFKQVTKILEEHGWVLEYSNGSHFYYLHPEKSGKVTVPRHKGDIPRGTLKAIFKQAGIKRNI